MNVDTPRTAVASRDGGCDRLLMPTCDLAGEQRLAHHRPGAAEQIGERCMQREWLGDRAKVAPELDVDRRNLAFGVTNADRGGIQVAVCHDTPLARSVNSSCVQSSLEISVMSMKTTANDCQSRT